MIPGPLPENFARALSNRHGDGLLITRNNVAFFHQLQAECPRISWQAVTKEDLRGRGLRYLIGKVRRNAWSVVVVEDSAKEMERRRDLYTLVLLFARTQSRWTVSSREGSATAESISFVRGLAESVAGAVADLVFSIAAIVWAYTLVWRMRRAAPRRRWASESTSHVPMLKTNFWFGVQAGGSVSHVRGVAAGMRALGLAPSLWTTSSIPVGPDRLPQKEIPPAKRPRIFEDAAMAGFNRTFLRATEREIAALRPAVIYQRHDVFNLCGLVLARKLGIPLVLEVNASEVWARQTWSRLTLKDLARRMERVAFENADRLVLITEELVPTVVALGGSADRIVVNPNGVEVERFDATPNTANARRELGWPEDWIICGFLGTFARWHGVLFLAEQIPLLAAADPRLRFLFIGEGDLRPEVQHRLTQAGVQDRAMFPGLLPPERVPRYLAACDILLSPHLPFDDGTEFFGSPTKLFEYMAAGRAIVASRLGSIARVVDDGETGVLIDPGDGPALFSAVTRLANHPEERLRLGQNARASAERSYTWKANARRALDGIILYSHEQR